MWLPPIELHQRALLFSECESELRETCGQVPQIRLGIILPGKADDTVICIAAEQDAALASLCHDLLDPQVLDEVEVDIA